MGRIGHTPPLQINITGRAGATALLCLAALALFSCSNGLLKDPRLYNSKQPSGMYVAPEPELGLTGGVDPFDDTEQWYNKRNSNGDGTKPDEVGFDASEFDTIQITGWFSSQNVPTYTMTKNAVWSPGDAPKGEYVHKSAPNTEGQGWKISGVTYYQYRGINPSYAPTGSYNTTLQKTSEGNPKLSRFYFYRFTGYGGGVQWLDNNLIAVDTHSKLVFAFSEPVQFSSMGAPTKWDPTDNEAFIGTTYQFYMYDPVGYVEKRDGKYNVVLYQWFKDNLAKGVYLPTLGGVDKNSRTVFTASGSATKTPEGAGKSPFNNHTKNFFEENMKILAGKSFYRREVTTAGLDGLVLYRYTFSDDGKTITRTAESWNKLPTTTNLASVTYSIGEGESATKGKVTGECTGTLELIDSSRTLKFSNGEVAVSNFTDPGPAFIERVKHNPTYELGVTKYVFSNDGKTLTMTYKNWAGSIKTDTYTYQKQESNSQARYSGYLLQLYDNDKDIKCSTVANVAVWSSVMEYLAHLKIGVGKTFTETVASVGIFEVRNKDNEGLYSDTLHSIEFSSDGKRATIKETVYDGSETSYDVLITDGSSGTQGQVNSQSVTLTEKDGSYQLTYLGKTYYAYYTDPGPSFIYRVKHDPKFVSTDGKTTYTFSNGGKKLQMKYTGGLWGIGAFDYEYDYVQPRDDSSTPNCAVYGSNDAALYYAGFELVEGDTVIQCSNESAGWADAIIWRMTYQANLVSQ